ncbi:ABC transporter substrate-binding protein [Meiothermus ruber]|jgi:iron complex transport system substrate-binding protein|uniref:Periplasmic binding protein n=1 Tax=Meiothermus ruber (strain ATCC 35948 / DSM 1279 / VKM B-1258 / 21) TaxID=504728 RepID=D3PM67_MEIRD|nr:iron-siderophore ABC transporter substrate-binding protein [Meiothermus ruber]ADD29173.1 periplasmic binding protein [Meiothermus ruber DSM 1279]AGK05377.1 periplasmic binding protein [Meiothermus ruber DSM 1279]MCL6528494.1 iron-siderophore ABC transporter substrate-binding protein [Meiothermus ruber]
MKRAWVLLFVASLATTALGQTCQGRLIQHAMGETCVPKVAQRVVVLDTGELDSALALGVKPVGAVTAPGQPFQGYLLSLTEGIQSVGTIQQPNLEKILALKPDLILSNKLRHGQIYPQLSRIAPTVMAETVGVVWKENLLLVGEALGRSTQAKVLLAQYQRRVTQLRNRLGGRGHLPSVSMVRFVPGQIRLYCKANFIGTILADIGLPRPKSQDSDKFAEFISQERIADMDADYIFYAAYGDPNQTELNAVLNHPLWRRLSAVQRGRAIRVEDDHWYLGIGPLAASQVLDDLERFLLRTP